MVNDYKAIKRAAVKDAFLSLSHEQMAMVMNLAGDQTIRGNNLTWRTFMLLVAEYLKGQTHDNQI